MAGQRFLVHLSRSEHRVVDPDDVYFVQADGDESIRGIEGQIAHRDTFSNDRQPDLRADSVLATPPFNISDWSGKLLIECQSRRSWHYRQSLAETGMSPAPSQQPRQHSTVLE